MTLLDALEAVRETIQSPARYTKKYYAVNKENDPVLHSDDDAVAWSLCGAVYKIAGLDTPLEREVKQALYHYTSMIGLTVAQLDISPTITHIHILGIIDNAIRAERDSDMAQLGSQDDFIKTALRLPKDLHAALQASALKEGRSMNAQALMLLTCMLRADEIIASAPHSSQDISPKPTSDIDRMTQHQASLYRARNALLPDKRQDSGIENGHNRAAAAQQKAIQTLNLLTPADSTAAMPISEDHSKMQDQFVIRLPDGLRGNIKAAADANKRSTTDEIMARLESQNDAPKNPAFIKTIEEYQALFEEANREASPSVFRKTEEFGHYQEEKTRYKFYGFVQGHKEAMRALFLLIHN